MGALKKLHFCVVIGFTSLVACSSGSQPGSTTAAVSLASLCNSGTTGPQITAPPANQVVQDNITLQGTCSTGVDVSVTGGGVNSALSVPCVNGAFSQPLQLRSGDGVKDIDVQQAGVTGEGKRCFYLDTTPPHVAIIPPSSAISNSNVIVVNGVCEAGLPVLLRVTGTDSSITTDCNSGGRFSTTINNTTGDGTKNVVVTQTDLAGNVGSANYNYIIDTVPPTISIKVPALNAYVQSSAVVSGACATGFSVSLSGNAVKSPVTTSCTGSQYSVQVQFVSAQGQMSLIAQQTDALGNIGTFQSSVIIDTIAPQIAIASPALGTLTNSGLTVAGSCTSGIPVVVGGSGVNSSISVPCNKGQFSAAVVFNSGDGSKTVMVSQTDAAGNVGSDSRNFVLSTAPPAIAIIGPAQGTVAASGVTLSGTCTDGIPIQVSGSGVNQASTVLCSNGQFSTPITFSAGNGSKTVVVTQTDAAGNVGTATSSFTENTTAPAIAITGPAVGTASKSGVTVTGTCSTGLNVTVAGSGVAQMQTVACSAGQFSAAVTFTSGDGTKNVTAAQTSPAGIMGSDNRNFSLLTVPPSVAITGPVAGTPTNSGLTVTGSCVSGLTVSVSGNVSSASGPCNNGSFAIAVVFTSGDGNKNVTASQTDAAGNVGSSLRSFVLDTVAPVLTLTSPAANTATKAGLTLVGACETGLTVNATGNISSPVSGLCANSGFSLAVSLISPDGSKTVTLSETDAAGNTSTVSGTFVLSTTAPAVTITSPAANTPTQGNITLAGSCKAGINVSVSGAITASVSVPCNNGAYTATVMLSSGDGNKNVAVSQTDSAGNVGSANRTFVLDSTPPVITITGPAAGTAAQNGVTITGTCESGLSVQISGAGVAAGSTACTNGAFSSAVTFSSGDGNKVITVTQTDAAGNAGTATITLVMDTTPPAVSITNSVLITNNPSITVSGNCETGLTVSLSGAVTTTTGCTGGTFSVAVSLPSPDGSKTVTAKQTDAAGNVGSNSVTFTLLTTPPALSITSPLSGANVGTSFTLTGSCAAGLTLNITGNLASATSTVCTAGGTFSVAMTASAGTGTKSLSISETDVAGNLSSVSATYNISATVTETFTASQLTSGMVDILFVDDNSAAMDADQAALGSNFPALATALSGVNWQLGITTTDCGNDAWGICGSLLPLTGSSGNSVNSSTANAATVFDSTIVRPETANCISKGACPTGIVEPLKATLNAAQKSATNNAGFFRSGAALAVVMQTSSNEQGSVPTSSATTPQQVVNEITSVFGAGKIFRNYTIGILTGDSACLSAQGQTAIGTYSTAPIALSTLTGGLSLSICSNPFSTNLTAIGNNMKSILPSQLTLSNTPVASSVQVNFTPSQNIAWTVNGNTITFASQVPSGTSIAVTYQP